MSVSALRAYVEVSSPLCFTTDIEWAPEWAIRDLFELADSFGVPLTPFVTHRSEYLWSRLPDDGAYEDVGIHPNFLPGSTHGDTVDAVIATTTALWPEAVAFRSHCFYDETRMLRKMAERGFRYDSNLCAFLQALLAPIRTAADTLRFPVFWEDDVHWSLGMPWSLASIREALEAPGLKIVNVHPLLVALNVPDQAFYESARVLYQRQDPDARAAAHRGAGTRTLVEELFAYATRDGRRPVRLRDLYQQAVERGIGVR